MNVTGLSVGKTPVGLSMFAQFDTGSSYTHLKEPAYGLFTKAVSAFATCKLVFVTPHDFKCIHSFTLFVL